MKLINIGIVGMGRIGKIHLSNITRFIPQAEVVAVAHANAEAQVYAKQFGVTQFYDEIEGLLKILRLTLLSLPPPQLFTPHILNFVLRLKKPFSVKNPWIFLCLLCKKWFPLLNPAKCIS